MNTLAQQLFKTLNGIWLYGGTVPQLAWAMKCSERQVAEALGHLHPLVNFRTELRVGYPGRAIIWFLRPKQK